MKHISMCVNYHLNECENNVNCSVCVFIVNSQRLYAENLFNGNVENLQKYCRVHHCIFLKLITISWSLAANEDFKNLLEQLNLPLSTKENELNLKKEMKKFSEVDG